MKLIKQDGEEFVAKEAKATGNFKDPGQQDVVILAVKAHQIPDVAPHLPALFGSDTSRVTVQNGIPWWYFQRHGGIYEEKRLESLDPTGIIEANVDAHRIIGCVVYPAATILEPGIVQHVEGDRFRLGELDGSETERCRVLMQALVDSGFRSRVIELSRLTQTPSPAIDTVYACVKLLNKTFADAKSRVVLSPSD